MIREIVNYTKHLKDDTPMLFKQGLEPLKGLHFLIKLNEYGELEYFPGNKGENWDYYDGRDVSSFLAKIIPYQQEFKRIGNNMNKVFDTKKQIESCSPYAVSFKKEKVMSVGFDNILKLLDNYFKNAFKECSINDEEKNKILQFKNVLNSVFEIINQIEDFKSMKKDCFINIYDNVSYEQYKKAHDNYLKKKLFNTDEYNSCKVIDNDTYGMSGFMNTLNPKKPFLKHTTASMYKGVPSRVQAIDTLYLNDFDILLRRKIFPSILPIFIDKNEFINTDDILRIFKENDKLSYTQIIKKLFDKNEKNELKNYYILNFNYKYELEDFDFVSKFRFSLYENGKYPLIKNIFKIKKNKEIEDDFNLENIFIFEKEIVRKIFNNSLVRIDKKKDSYQVNYFGEIKPEYVSGGDIVYQIILKYRKAFYDYIYKSKTEAISSYMWDDIMWNSLIGDVRNDKISDKGYHTKEYSIKEKLNIWFSLYTYFKNNERRMDMASKIPELLEKMRQVSNDSSVHFDSVEEFAFGAGQVIYFLLNQSKKSERTHALLEPFIQKVKIEQLQNSIAQSINMYKHEISFGHGRFERLSAEVLGFYMDTNLRNYQRLLLAGYFSDPVIYEKKINKEEY